ncbi:MAG: molybdopterin-binding protein [Pseudomonadota bacterium]
MSAAKRSEQGTPELACFDKVMMVDWSGGADRGPRPVKDSIWAAIATQTKSQTPVYLRNRTLAETHLSDQISESLAKGERLLIGFDFPFGYPSGFVERLTGQTDPLVFWAFLAARAEQDPKGAESGRLRATLSAELNAKLPGEGPFWFNPFSKDIPGLPRKKPSWTHPFEEWRAAEKSASGTFSLWQIGGAGAVGGQVMMGLPVLERLRQKFAGQVSVWPFEPLDRQIVFAEIWPSLLAPEIERLQEPEEIKDATQVRVLAKAFAQLKAPELAKMLAVSAPEEGWILGLGHEATLREALKPKLIPPRMQNDCFAMPQGVDWMPVEEAQAQLLDRLVPITAYETCALEEAQGRVLSSDVAAVRAHPPAANSAVDGYGFAQASLEGQSPHVLPLAQGRAAAGAPFDGELLKGQAVRILTGATVPAGVDTIVLEEDCRVEDGHIAFDGPIKPGANLRPMGEDIAKDQIVMARGRKLGAFDLGVLRSVGVADVPVMRSLKVAVMSTGSEITEDVSNPAPDRIYDANGPMLRAMLRAWGYEVVNLGIQADTREAIETALSEGAAAADVIFTSGGASAGDEDHVSRALTQRDAYAAWRIALKPGRPLALGVWDETPVIGLPGNPVAAAVCTLVFGYSALASLQGAPKPMPDGQWVQAAFKKRKKAGRREFLRARLGINGVEVFASEGSGRISGLAWADGLVDLPSDAQEIEPGTLVRYIPFSDWGL